MHCISIKLLLCLLVMVRVMISSTCCRLKKHCLTLYFRMDGNESRDSLSALQMEVSFYIISAGVILKSAILINTRSGPGFIPLMLDRNTDSDVVRIETDQHHTS